MATQQMQQQQANQQPQPTFRDLTRQQIVNGGNFTITTFGQVYTFQLPNTGYLANIYLQGTGTVTIPASPSGNWSTYPPIPYAMIRRLRVYTSENVELVNMSGWNMIYWWSYQNRIATFATDLVSYLNTNGISQLYATKTGALVAGTFTLSCMWEIPIMTDDATMLSLILLQTLDVRCFMEITFANAADFVASGATNPTAVAMTFTPTYEFFSIPPAGMPQPNLSLIHIIQEEDFPFNSVGDVIYRPQIGNIYMSICGIVESSGANISNNPSYINTIRMVYAQTVAPYYEPYALHLWRLKKNFGFTPVDGGFNLDFSLGSGTPALLDPRDLLNSSQQTDLQVIVNLSNSLTPTNAIMRITKEQLAGIG